MTLQVSVAGGTAAGTRKPWVGGHGPKCVCSKCEKPAVRLGPVSTDQSMTWQELAASWLRVMETHAADA